MKKESFVTNHNPKHKKTNIMVDEEIWKKFKYYCRLKGISFSKYLMQLVNEELKKQKEDFEDRIKKERRELSNMFSKNQKK